MKKTKVIIPALGILLLSTAASVTGTVAWFTASNTVAVSGLNFQAQSEDGIVIANEALDSWTTSATASHSGASLTFHPASTADLVTWYHGFSDSAIDGQSNVEYTTIASPTISEGVGSTTINEENANIFLKNVFYIQSATAKPIASQNIYLKGLTIGGSSVSTELNKALRVGVGFKSTPSAESYSKVTIFAPVSGATTSYGVNGATSGVTAISDTSGTTSYVAQSVDIPAYAAAGTNALAFEVFVYLEGEDEACMSSNVTATLDALTISFTLGNIA